MKHIDVYISDVPKRDGFNYSAGSYYNYAASIGDMLAVIRRRTPGPLRIVMHRAETQRPTRVRLSTHLRNLWDGNISDSGIAR